VIPFSVGCRHGKSLLGQLLHLRIQGKTIPGSRWDGAFFLSHQSLDALASSRQGVFEHVARKGLTIHPVGLELMVHGTVPIGKPTSLQGTVNAYCTLIGHCHPRLIPGGGGVWDG
jgi:hypothetical protein